MLHQRWFYKTNVIKDTVTILKIVATFFTIVFTKLLLRDYFNIGLYKNRHWKKEVNIIFRKSLLNGLKIFVLVVFLLCEPLFISRANLSSLWTPCHVSCSHSHLSSPPKLLPVVPPSGSQTPFYFSNPRTLSQFLCFCEISLTLSSLKP